MPRISSLIAVSMLAVAALLRTLPAHSQPPSAKPPASFDAHVAPRGKLPRESLDAIEVAAGFMVEQVATEPLVKDPIAFDWAADGKLWVVEMGDYPNGLDGHGKPGGIVSVLEDKDGDGRYDKQTTFLDGLSFPNGVMPWRNGVLISCAPDILYAEDRDGDGKADHRRILFTGFVEGNQQHRLNGFELGLDGWVYGANGDSGGTVRSLMTGKTVAISGRDFRFKPDTGEFEAESGQTQYGRHRDDWGHWFGNSNPTWGWQFMLSDQDLKHNPAYAPPVPRQTLEPDTRLYPRSRTLVRFNNPHASNHVTSANSPTPYRDDLFGPDFDSSLFVSEPVHNLVHRMILAPFGPSMKGGRAPSDAAREFLASSDHWFRPTMLKTGPDGSLWIADMYRAVIEHPEWIPDDWEPRLDLRAGSDQGRMYRVYPVGKKPRTIPRLDKLDIAGLVTALDSPSGWQRDTAQRLLLHHGGAQAVAPLRSLIATTKRPKTRVQAIWTLADLGSLDEVSALAGLNDSNPRVRESIIAAAAPLAVHSSSVANTLLALANDSDQAIRFRVALAVATIKGPNAAQTLVKLAIRDGDDAWIQAAILTSAAPHLEPLLLALLTQEERAPASAPAQPRRLVEPLLTMAGLSSGPRLLNDVAQAIATPGKQGAAHSAWQYRALASLLDAGDHPRQLDPALTKTFAALWISADHAIAHDTASLADRVGAAQLLGLRASDSRVRDQLLALLSPRTPVELQQAAVSALAHSHDPRLAEMLVVDWKRHSPTVRAALLDTLLTRPSWTESLLSSLEDTCVPPAEIDPARRQRLLKSRDRSVRSRAEALFVHQPQARQSILDAYRPALHLKADPAAGARTYQTLCATCHRIGNLGIEVGPDLTSLNDKSPESLMTAILDPNRAFEARYAAFTVAITDGRVLNGLISNESSTAITLRRQEGREDILLRSRIEEMSASGQSLMPEGLEKDLKPQDLANLFAFIASPVPAPAPKP